MNQVIYSGNAWTCIAIVTFVFLLGSQIGRLAIAIVRLFR